MIKQKMFYAVLLAAIMALSFSYTALAATPNNMYYTSGRILRLRRDSQFPVSVYDMTRHDFYTVNRFEFRLPGRFNDWLGWGEYIIDDDLLYSVRVETGDNPHTSIIFEQKQVLAYNFWEDSEYIYIQPVHPRERYDRIVVLDPGHGGRDPGAVGHGLRESDINLDISNRLINLIQQNGHIKVYATRTTDVLVDLFERPRWANEIGDIFISIHQNAAANSRANGTETYYTPRPQDSELGFSSRQMAEIFQRNLLRDLGLADRGVKSSRFVVLRNAVIPAALVEIGFVSNSGDAAQLRSEDFRQRAAESLYRSILETFDTYTPRR
jgi:N-acetylmuramoyl-L-alanine amidase